MSRCCAPLTRARVAQDLENTTGSWDVYGVAETKRYAELQNTFFERTAAAVTRRESMYSFLAFTSTAALLLWGGKGAKARARARDGQRGSAHAVVPLMLTRTPAPPAQDAKLPITVGPQQKPALGPRDRL